MPPRILHIVENGIEKKRCSRCKQYLPLDNYIYKKDRWDKLSNECNRCRLIRNRRRYNKEFDIEEEDVEDEQEEKEKKEAK